ncbi:MAG: rod shape-determining protein MreC [Neisseria sp.]|nr:rod shape-determining protein MreC [Neisseria sp.]
MEPLSFTRKRLRPSGKLVALSLAAIALMVLDNRYAAVKQFKSHAATALQPMLWLANQPVRLYEYTSGFFQTQSALLAENGRLKTENSRLSAENSRHSAQLAEWRELRTLHKLSTQGIGSSTAAEVISNGKDPLSDKLILNKGSRDGIRTGDAVIDRHGLIGQITQVHTYGSELTVLTNAHIVIPVTVARTGVRSLLYGSGESVKLRYFPNDADLQAGDVLLTSGLDSVYPSGIPVAKVETAERASGTPYYRTQLKALASPRSSKYVLVLPQAELPAAIAEIQAAEASAPKK